LGIHEANSEVETTSGEEPPVRDRGKKRAKPWNAKVIHNSSIQRLRMLVNVLWLIERREAHASHG